MKEVTEELRNYLHAHKNFFMCDLYDLELASGLLFRYANYDMDIISPNGNLYTCKGPIFERDKISLSSKITVDKLTVTISIDTNDVIGGIPIMQLANNGGFDCSKLTLYRCIMSDPGIVIDTVEMFGGDIEVKDGGGLELTLEVKSSAQKLNVEYPTRKYYPTCPYSLYSAGCGLNIDDFTVAGQITGIAADYYLFGTDLTLAEGHLANGGIEWTSGVLTGVSAPIKYSSADGSITLLIPTSVNPGVGDTFRSYPGCPKDVSSCRGKFNNFMKNRSTPYIPLGTTII